jgi:hypothetical protein
MVSTFIFSCTKEESVEGISEGRIDDENYLTNKSLNYNYDDFLIDAHALNDLTTSAIQSAKDLEFKNQDEINDYLTEFYINNGRVSYIDSSIYSFDENSENLTIKDMGFSNDVDYYFNQIITLNEQEKYTEIVALLKNYKVDLKNNPDLLALSGIFATVEVYEAELLGVSFLLKNTGDCPPTGSQIAGGAINGAVAGAIWGFKFGSFFGPAGTAAGAAGGAIVGALVGSILAIGSGSILNGDDC